MDDLFKCFSEWLDDALKNGFPDSTAAIAFNLYEGTNNEKRCWLAEIGFCSCFDADDEYCEWACYAELLDDRFIWDEDTEWEAAQNTAEKLIKEYLSKGRYSEKIKALQGIGVGFVDGDMTLLYVNNDSQTPINTSYPHYDPEKSEKLVKQKSNEI